MTARQPHILEFDDLRDAAKRVLLRKGEPAPLTPKVFDTLLYLAANRGKVIEKDDLMGAIWPDTAVEENNLNQSISTLRGALGENRGENRYIATFPGKDFRFIARIARAPTGPAEGPSRVTLAVLPADSGREPVVPATHSPGMV
jgi:DNA-binding winged helix-turn-helix (wHTH) protein